MARHVVVAVDDSSAAEGALAFALEILKPDDTLHLLHAIPTGLHLLGAPELEMAATVGAVVEDSPEQKKRAYDAAIEMIKSRFCANAKLAPPPALVARGVEAAPDGAPDALDGGGSKSGVRLEVVRAAQGNDAVGAAVCSRADALGKGTVLVLAKHSRGAVAEFFMGSVCGHVTKRCKTATVCVTHGGDGGAAVAAGGAAAEAAANGKAL